jgi:RHS repeat-associated protein
MERRLCDESHVQLGGGALTQSYPSGRTVSYGYDAAGQTSSFNGNLGDGVSRTYATGIIYNERGQMTREQYGTATPIYHKLQYNSRGQMWDIRLSTGSDIGGTWDRGALQLYYDGALTEGGSGADNNGNVRMMKHFAPTDEASQVWAHLRQNYTYDSLNRLTSVTEHYNKSTNLTETQAYLQAFKYDRWGNRQIDLGTNPALTWGMGVNAQQFDIEAATNRLKVPTNQIGELRYNLVGNLTYDTYTGSGIRRYDGENRMVTATDSFGNLSRYTYDGDGKRVRRLVSNTEVWQVYGLEGELVAEYAANAAPATTQKEYGYRAGELLVTAQAAVAGSRSVQWTVADHLGTPRMIVDRTGGSFVQDTPTTKKIVGVSRHDYLPFGEELTANVGGRMAGQGYSQFDGVRQKFTGHERDGETGLDYMKARYYSSVQGRFTSPDDFWKDSQVSDPQSWNKYAYARNNPLKYIDPEGEKATVKIETDEKNKTGTITINASIAIWTGDGNISQADLNTAAANIETSIEGGWNGTFVEDGITYTVKTDVTVTAYGGEGAAGKSGAQNIIEMTNGAADSAANSRSDRPAMSISRSPDYGRWNIREVLRSQPTQEPAHEFGHLLGVRGHLPSGIHLMRQGGDMARRADGDDYGRVFSAEIGKHRRDSRQYNFSGTSTRFRLGTETNHSSTRIMRSAHPWWN